LSQLQGCQFCYFSWVRYQNGCCSFDLWTLVTVNLWWAWPLSHGLKIKQRLWNRNCLDIEQPDLISV
jgi:hypothetical protein